MKIYISGKITGLPESEYKAKFSDAEELLSAIGLNPVNPTKNGLPKNANWTTHMTHDIQMLFGCEAIFMLENWMQSRGARIEHKIAQETDIEIMYASENFYQFAEIQKLQLAIKDATGLCFADYTRSHRGRYALYARLIYTDKCKNLGLNIRQVAMMLNRDRSTITYYMNKFDDEFKFNPEFREIAEKVNTTINCDNHYENNK